MPRWLSPGGPRRPTHAPTDDLHDLLGVGGRIAGPDRGHEAAGDVVLHEQQAHGVHGGAQRGCLLEDVDAVLVALDHARDAPHLALHARQAAQDLGAVLVVAPRASRGPCGAWWSVRAGAPWSSTGARACRLDAGGRRSRARSIARPSPRQPTRTIGRLGSHGWRRLAADPVDLVRVRRMRRSRTRPGASASWPSATACTSWTSHVPAAPRRRSPS